MSTIKIIKALGARYAYAQKRNQLWNRRRFNGPRLEIRAEGCTGAGSRFTIVHCKCKATSPMTTTHMYIHICSHWTSAFMPKTDLSIGQARAFAASEAQFYVPATRGASK